MLWHCVTQILQFSMISLNCKIDPKLERFIGLPGIQWQSWMLILHSYVNLSWRLLGRKMAPSSAVSDVIFPSLRACLQKYTYELCTVCDVRHLTNVE